MKRKITLLVTIIYLILIFRVIVFKSDVIIKGARLYNLVPLKTIELYIFGYIKGYVSFKSFFLNIFGNIFAFVPMGFLFNKYFKKSSISFLLSFLIIFSIESIQFFFKLGIFDVDDILLNIFGSVLGIIIYRGFIKAYNTGS